MVRRLDEEARRLLERRLGAGGPAFPFAAAVVRQLTRHPREGDDAALSAARTADRVVDLLLAAGRGEEEAEHALAADHAMLSAFFQNSDLLYQHHHPAADAVSLLILQALHHATEAEEDAAR